MRKLHARVADIRRRVTQQEVVIELRIPIEGFADVVSGFNDADVIVLRRDETDLPECPYGMLDQ